jgi:phage terminase small subunit
MYRLHPAVSVMQDADRRVRSWLTEFGKTPSARSRVKAFDSGRPVHDLASEYFS